MPGKTLCVLSIGPTRDAHIDSCPSADEGRKAVARFAKSKYRSYAIDHVRREAGIHQTTACTSGREETEGFRPSVDTNYISQVARYGVGLCGLK